MKAGKTLQELAIELDRQRAVKKDMIVDTRRPTGNHHLSLA